MSELRAEMWRCGDEVCDCTQPIVVRVTPNLGFSGAVHREVLWAGTFRSGATLGELAEQEWELEDARQRLILHPEEEG